MSDDPELAALTSVFASLKDLDSDAQKRVLDYVTKKLGLRSSTPKEESRIAVDDPPVPSVTLPADPIEPTVDETDGISPVAVKFIRRNDLTVSDLGKLFSLGADEIDLVAKTVPGKSKKARVRSVALLKGFASYLSTGAARINYEQIKETCLHYNAYDSPNHAANLKAIASELSGSTASGFVLTARGLNSAAELVKEMLQSS